MPVRAAAFIGDPIGAEIPFLEDMDGQAARFGDGHGFEVDRSGIAIKHQIGHAFVRDQALQMAGPVLDRASIGEIALPVMPERAVALVEADAPDICARGPQHPAKPVEERPMWALQEQKNLVQQSLSPSKCSDTAYRVETELHSGLA